MPPFRSNRSWKFSLMLLVALTLLSPKAWAQDTLSQPETTAIHSTRCSNPFIHSLALEVVADSYLDSNRPFHRTLRPPMVGLEFATRISHQWALHLSARYTQRAFINDFPLEVGDVVTREAFFLDLGLYRELFRYRTITAKALAGLSLRYGFETIFIGQYYWELILEQYGLLDPGAFTGIRLQQNITKRISVSAESRFAYYHWTNYKNMQHFLSSPNVPTRSMLAIQLALHFNFR